MDTSESLRETAATEPEAVLREPELAVHPGPRQYVVVAVVLAALTALEVAVYYTDIPHPLLVSLLTFFAFWKFVLVVLWFMHLRFDSVIFRRLFITGLSLAFGVYLIVLFTFRVFIRS
ncbi:MAG TPA: cytochrome C oxidase subunit IV family protein [Actinomycetota bacterium]